MVRRSRTFRKMQKSRTRKNGRSRKNKYTRKGTRKLRKNCRNSRKIRGG